MSIAIPLADGFGPQWANAWGVDEYGVFVEFTFRGVAQRMRWIEAGTFMMGSPEHEKDRERDEAQHLATLPQGFWLADTPCTQALWEAAMGSNPSYFKGRERPVEQVSWEECQKFLESINREWPDLELRLLTEAEWEYSCRAGTKGPFSFGGSITPEQVNYDGHYPYVQLTGGVFRRETTAVGTFPPNAWGLHDMHGNVWEWCADWYGAYERKSVVDPTGPADGGRRVLRGGSWNLTARAERSARRNALGPASRDKSIGFRFARGHW